jgi:hypothetical protein
MCESVPTCRPSDVRVQPAQSDWWAAEGQLGAGGEIVKTVIKREDLSLCRPRRDDGAASNKWVMKHERPVEMGSGIMFQAHTRNGVCGLLRH